MSFLSDAFGTGITVFTRLVTGAQARWIGCAPSAVQRIYFGNHSSHADFALIWASPLLMVGRIEVFWVDERMVPPDDPESNYGVARAAWLDAVPIAAERIHRVRGEEPAPAASAPPRKPWSRCAARARRRCSGPNSSRP